MIRHKRVVHYCVYFLMSSHLNPHSFFSCFLNSSYSLTALVTSVRMIEHVISRVDTYVSYRAVDLKNRVCFELICTNYAALTNRNQDSWMFNLSSVISGCTDEHNLHSTRHKNLEEAPIWDAELPEAHIANVHRGMTCRF